MFKKKSKQSKINMMIIKKVEIYFMNLSFLCFFLLLRKMDFVNATNLSL